MSKNFYRKVIRVSKKDSAFIYSILESYEGLTAYSTLDTPKECSYRDIELLMTLDFVTDVENLMKEFGDTVYEL